MTCIIEPSAKYHLPRTLLVWLPWLQHELSMILAMGTDLTAIKLQNKSINRNQTGLDLSQRHFYKHLISVSDTSVYSS